MLAELKTFAHRGLFSDSELVLGNKLLVYINCCLAGMAYPFGTLDAENKKRVPLETFRCISALKAGDSEEQYPYLKLLLQYDAQQFLNVVSTCADTDLFLLDNRLQRFADTVTNSTSHDFFSSSLVFRSVKFALV